MEEHLNSEVSPYLFNGKERDSETGLYYYGARYYDPKISLWLSVDPLAGYDPINEIEHYIDGQHNGGVFNSGNLNVYGYCYQNPVRFLDPDGNNPIIIGMFLDAFLEVFTQVATKVDQGKDMRSAFRSINWNHVAIEVSSGLVGNFLGPSRIVSKFGKFFTNPKNIKMLTHLADQFIKLIIVGINNIAKEFTDEKDGFNAAEVLVNTWAELGLGAVLSNSKFLKRYFNKASRKYNKHQGKMSDLLKEQQIDGVNEKLTNRINKRQSKLDKWEGRIERLEVMEDVIDKVVQRELLKDRTKKGKVEVSPAIPGGIIVE